MSISYWFIQLTRLAQPINRKHQSRLLQLIHYHGLVGTIWIFTSTMTRALLRLERTMNLLEGGKEGKGERVGRGRREGGERGWGGDVGERGRVGRGRVREREREGGWGEGGWGEREGGEGGRGGDGRGGEG